MTTSQSEDHLKLPPCDLNTLRAEIDYYGASRILSKYCGINLMNKPLEGTAWGHGWFPDYFINTDPRIVTAQSLFDKSQTILTSKTSIESYLKSCGFMNTHAIGLPIVYVQEERIERLKNSLLVMPAHSLDYTTHSSWKFAEYVAEIKAVSKDFEHVYVCIHPSCLKQGYWVNEFRGKGFKIIEGVNIYDKNALRRLQFLMKTFEFITTNSFGSHLTYGAYFGAKVSIYGTYAEFKEEDFAIDPFYTVHGDLLEASLELISKSRVEKELSCLFTYPIEALARVDWGRYEVGADQRKSPREIRNLIDWSYKKSIIHDYNKWIESLRGKSLSKPKA